MSANREHLNKMGIDIRRDRAISVALIRKAMVAASALVILTAIPARADCPAVAVSAADSDFPCGINLVGVSGTPDPRGKFTIVLRDFAHAPCTNTPVCIQFGACLGAGGVGDIHVCQSQVGAWVGDTPFGVCSGLVVGMACGYTDATGTISWSLVGGASNPGGAPGAGFKCASVLAGTVPAPLAGVAINVGAFDENGVGGVNPTDLSAWLADAFSLKYFGRSDYNCSGIINPSDLSLLLGVSLAGSSFFSCSAYCN